MTPPDPSVIARLTTYFRRNGYVRRANAARRTKEKQQYKKGDEVRLVAETEAELADIRDLLAQAGFKVGRSFEKANQWRQPIYGMAAVARFLALVGEPPAPPPPPRRGRGRPATRFLTHILFDWDKYRRPKPGEPPAAGATAG